MAGDSKTAVSAMRRLVEDRRSTRETIATAYVKCLQTYRATAPQWREIHRLIRTRWTRSGLEFIKRRARQIAA